MATGFNPDLGRPFVSRAPIGGGSEAGPWPHSERSALRPHLRPLVSPVCNVEPASGRRENHHGEVSNNPKEAAYALQLASYYAMAGQREKMRSALQRLLDNPQDFPDARLQVGAFYSRLQEWD